MLARYVPLALLLHNAERSLVQEYAAEQESPLIGAVHAGTLTPARTVFQVLAATACRRSCAGPVAGT